MGAGLSWRNTDACQTFRSQGLPCLRLDCPLMPTHMGQRIYPVQEGPISPQEGSTWGLAGHCSQCYINPHMDTDCPPIRATLQTGAAQAEWAKHHLSQMGRQRDILCDFWHPTILDWGWPELKKERTFFFSRSTRREDRKKVIQLNSLTHMWPCENPVPPGSLRVMEREEAEGKLSLNLTLFLMLTQ